MERGTGACILTFERIPVARATKKTKRQTALELQVFCQSTISGSIIMLNRCTVNIGQKDQGGATEPASGR